MGEALNDLVGILKDLIDFARANPGQFLLLTAAVLAFAWARSRPGYEGRL